MAQSRKDRVALMRAYWASMTAAERSAELKRRIAKRRRTAQAKKKQAKLTKAKQPHSKGGPAHVVAQDIHVAYCFGRTEAFLDHYASSAGVPRAALAHGVSELLRRQAHGQVLGS
jgi:hypothetical protein